MVASEKVGDDERVFDIFFHSVADQGVINAPAAISLSAFGSV
jgi:hypothetical protein